MTKYLAAEVLDRHGKKLEASFPGGRAEKAPTLNAMFTTHAVWELTEDGRVHNDEEKDNYEGDLRNDIIAAVNDARRKDWKSAMRTAWDQKRPGGAGVLTANVGYIEDEYGLLQPYDGVVPARVCSVSRSPKPNQQGEELDNYAAPRRCKGEAVTKASSPARHRPPGVSRPGRRSQG